MELKLKYRLGKDYKSTKGAKRSNDNPSTNPRSAARRGRVGMNPRKAWGQGLEGRKGK
jgi:hypothetical protein